MCMGRELPMKENESLVPIEVYENIPYGMTVAQKVTLEGRRFISQTAKLVDEDIQ